jgi:PAS domain S-box-containing protein
LEQLFPYFLAGVTAVVTALAAAVTYLFKELQSAKEADNKCKAEQSSLRAQIVALNVMLEQRRCAFDQEMIATVIINAKTGQIVEWAPAATMLLHWTQRERMGKSISDLIPERYRQRQSTAMQAMISSGRAPRRGPFDLHALNRHHQEVPVEITLSGWYESDTYLVAAAIRLRQEGSDDGNDPTSRRQQ